MRKEVSTTIFSVVSIVGGLIVMAIVIPFWLFAFVLMAVIFLICLTYHWASGGAITVYEIRKDDDGNEIREEVGKIRRLKFTKKEDVK